MKSKLKIAYIAAMALFSVILGIAVFDLYYQYYYVKPTYFPWVSDVCGGLYRSGASEAEMDKCRASAIVSFKGMLFMWYFAAPLFLAWLAIPVFSSLWLIRGQIKKTLIYASLYLVAVFIFYIFWIKFWDA